MQLMTHTAPVPHKITSGIFIIALLGCLFYFYETIIELAPSTIVQGLMRSFQINGATVSALDMTYYITFALMQIPGGILLDRFGSRRILIWAAACCCFGLIGFGLCDNLILAFLCRLITGLGGTFGLVGALYILNKYLPGRYLGFGLCLAIMLGQCGGLFAQPLNHLQAAVGWSILMILLGCLAALMLLLFWFFLEDEGWPELKSQRLHLHIFENFKTLIRTPIIWPIALYGGLIYLPTGSLANIWLLEYLKVYYQADPLLIIANMTAALFLGWIIGSPIVGWISDRLAQRRPVILIGGLGLLFCLLAFTYCTTLPPSFMFALMFLIGLFSSSNGLTYAMGCEAMPKALGGTAVGFINMMAILPSMIISPLFGMILDHNWQQVFNHGARIYPLIAYQRAMILEYGVVILALLIGYFFVSETLRPSRIKTITHRIRK